MAPRTTSGGRPGRRPRSTRRTSASDCGCATFTLLRRASPPINRIRVTVTYSSVPTAAIGSAASPILRADIGGTCKMNNGTAGACNSGTGVYATTVGGAPPPLVKPQIDLDWWWKNAKPGPKHPCTEPGNTFPNTFDNDSATTTAPNNSVQNVTDGEITPMNASYTCQVEGERRAQGRDLVEQRDPRAQGLRARSTSTATSASTTTARSSTTRAERSSTPATTSSSTSGSAPVAAASTNCAATPATMAAWNPSTDLLTILAGDKDTTQPCCPTLENAEFDHSTQGTNSAQGDDPAAPGAFQGIVYAKGNCQIHEFFKLSGPVICNRITIDKVPRRPTRRSRRSRRWARSWTARSTSIPTTPARSR